jgi:uncharacterized membrane protein
MAKKNNNAIIGAIVVVAAIFFLMNMGGDETSTTPDLSSVVQPSASFTASNMHKIGTGITTEYVRVIKNNGIKNDLGQISLNSGTLNTEPNAVYSLYFGENSSTYYTNVESYTAPAQESVDNVRTSLCEIDTTPSVTVYDEDEQVNAAGSNVIAIGTDETVTAYVKVKAAADKCYGNPDSQVPDNAICFEYSSSVYNDVSLATGASATPYQISDAKAAGYALKCYKLPKLADNQDTGKLPITLEANGNPTAANGNVTIRIRDAGFDLNADDLTEIFGFEDEDNNALGSAKVINDTIHIS